jgi:hypothetical protein
VAQYTSYSTDGIKFERVYDRLLLVMGTKEFLRVKTFTSEGTEFEECTNDPQTRKPVILSTVTRTVREVEEGVGRIWTIEGAMALGDKFILKKLKRVEERKVSGETPQPEWYMMAFGEVTDRTPHREFEQLAHKYNGNPDSHLPTLQVAPSQFTEKSKVEVFWDSDTILLTIEPETELELHLTNEDSKFDW